MIEQTNITPEGYTTVAPWVVTDDTAAFLEFVIQAFAGEELGRVSTEDGLIGHADTSRRHHRAGLRPPGGLVCPAEFAARIVANADDTFSRAIAAGGDVVTSLADNAFGQRGGRIKDPFGNIWWVVANR